MDLQIFHGRNDTDSEHQLMFLSRAQWTLPASRESSRLPALCRHCRNVTSTSNMSSEECSEMTFHATLISVHSSRSIIMMMPMIPFVSMMPVDRHIVPICAYAVLHHKASQPCLGSGSHPSKHLHTGSKPIARFRLAPYTHLETVYRMDRPGEVQPHCQAYSCASRQTIREPATWCLS